MADYYDFYDYEFYDQSNTNEEIYEKHSLWSNLSFQQLCNQCVVPAGLSTFNIIGTTLISCIFFRLFIVISKYQNLQLLTIYLTKYQFDSLKISNFHR